jgi:glutaredoxin 3
MKPVEIYSTPYCPYCIAAKRLLMAKGVEFVETDVSNNPAQREKMSQRAKGGRTVPQIFIDGKHIGGSDDLHLLERQGKLDQLLAG